ncbi:glutathione transferase GstA [Thalassospira marina]|uniref:Glutathione transferase GstA n=2 Tax=Thalassospira marina TaxID=2048283 RepID=A0A2N3KDE4_9PROT|nr:glutathione transferase GstA [Thalassospira marina]PKR48534.1 glutathione transferase GstA [Thalassospira marina]
MILYYMPGACSLSTHISLLETGEQFSLVKVDHKNNKTENGENFLAINPDGSIPTLKLASDHMITDCAGALHYLADHFWESGVSPEPETPARARMDDFLRDIEQQLHVQFEPLHQKVKDDAIRNAAIARLSAEFEKYENLFSDGRKYLLGREFSVADAYLFVAINWAGISGINIFRWPHIGDFGERMRARPSVLAALRAEGLLAD